jgi:hypothetical protein
MKSSSARRGSVLITCLVFSIIIAITLTSYLRLAGNSYTQADRAFLNTTALALAEQGLEQGLEAYNQLDEAATPAEAWPGWTINGTVATLKNTGITLDNGAVGTIQVYVTDYNPAPGTVPRLVAKATVLPASGLGLSRLVEITLRRRSIFVGGLIARETITFSTSTTVASWDSDPDNNPATPAVGYTTAAKSTQAFVGTISTADDAINTAGADIFGNIGTGGGTVAHTGGAVLTDNPAGTGWNTELVDTNFACNLPVPVAPALPATVNTVTASIATDTTLPRSGDAAAADGKYYYNFASGAGVVLGGNDKLTVSDKVVLYLQNHAGATALSIGGTGKVDIAGGGTLAIYTNGNLAIGGNGVGNSNPNAASCLIYGTNTGTGQTISLTGNATTATAVNAPNANFSITGSGELWGSVIARTIVLNGNAAFRYDEALPKLITTTGTGNPWGIAKWREMTLQTERETYVANFNF